MDTKTNAIAAAIKEAQARGLVPKQALPEAEYLKRWADWQAVIEAAYKASGTTIPW